MPEAAWLEGHVGDLLSLEYGASLPAHRREGDEFPVFGSSGRVGTHKSALVEGPGIVVGRKGTVGAVAWSSRDFWPIDTTYFVHNLGHDLRWLFWLLQRLPLDQLDSSTGVPGLNRNDAYELSLLIPPLGEQRRIAEILDTVDEAIRKTEEIVAKLKQVKQGLLHDLLTRGIDEQGELRDPDRHPEQFKDSPLGRIPKPWEVETLGGLLEGIDGGWSPACIEQPPPTGHWGVLKVSAVSGGVFRAHESKTLPSGLAPRPELEVKQGDVVLTRANGVAELVGVTAQAAEIPPCLMLSDKLLRLRPGTRMSRDFLGTVMSSWIVRRQVARLMSGSSGQKNISQAQIRSFLVPLPSLAEQAECVAHLRLVGKRRSSEEASLAKLRLVKNGLMEDLLTGRVRVTPLLEEAPE